MNEDKKQRLATEVRNFADEVKSLRVAQPALTPFVQRYKLHSFSRLLDKRWRPF